MSTVCKAPHANGKHLTQWCHELPSSKDLSKCNNSRTTNQPLTTTRSVLFRPLMHKRLHPASLDSEGAEYRKTDSPRMCFCNQVLSPSSLRRLRPRLGCHPQEKLAKTSSNHIWSTLLMRGVRSSLKMRISRDLSLRSSSRQKRQKLRRTSSFC